MRAAACYCLLWRRVARRGLLARTVHLASAG